MNAFCTNCGAALNPDAMFCTGCGAAVRPSIEPVRRPRRWPWIVALIVLFALGFWLGRHLAPKCPQCPAPATTGAGGGGGSGGGGGGGRMGRGDGGKGDPGKGAGAGGGGTGRVLGDGGRAAGSGGGASGGGGPGTGDMVGGGDGGGGGTVVAHGYDGSATGGAGSDDGGGGGPGGKSKLGDAPNGTYTEKTAQDPIEKGVLRLAAGVPMTLGNGDVPPADARDIPKKVLSARDFTYDKTGLPRYLDANQAVFSAMSYDVTGRVDAYGSACGIVTGSSFDDVVAWYRSKLPGGWSNTTIGDLNRLGAVAQQFSPDKIMQMIAGANGSAPAKAVDDVPATVAADRMRLSMFSPPAKTKGALGVMVVQHGDQPVEILMNTHVMP